MGKGRGRAPKEREGGKGLGGRCVAAVGRISQTRPQLSCGVLSCYSVSGHGFPVWGWQRGQRRDVACERLLSSHPVWRRKTSLGERLELHAWLVCCFGGESGNVVAEHFHREVEAGSAIN